LGEQPISAGGGSTFSSCFLFPESQVFPIMKLFFPVVVLVAGGYEAFLAELSGFLC